MSQKVFISQPNNADVPAVITPAWATHIIRRKADGVLFFARNTQGHSEFYVGEGPTFEFHPDGYELHSRVTSYQIGKDATVGEPAKSEVEESQAIGQKWWIKNGTKGELIKIVITYLTEKVITIETCDTAVAKTFLRERIEFVERVSD